MTITINEKEYEAICEVVDQVSTDYEAATDENYLSSMNETISHVNNVIRKYRYAKMKAREFQEIRAYVVERNGNKKLRPRDIDKLTRELVKKINKEKK